jgi:hypothetical protein
MSSWLPLRCGAGLNERVWKERELRVGRVRAGLERAGAVSTTAEGWVPMPAAGAGQTPSAGRAQGRRPRDVRDQSGQAALATRSRSTWYLRTKSGIRLPVPALDVTIPPSVLALAPSREAHHSPGGCCGVSEPGLSHRSGWSIDGTDISRPNSTSVHDVDAMSIKWTRLIHKASARTRACTRARTPARTRSAADPLDAGG